MNFQTYSFEIKDLLTQFVNAFDEAVINRYTKERVAVDKIAVRYVYAPKQRVLHDLINKAKHITLPCVSFVISAVRRDPSRVFNKINGSYSTLNTSLSATHAGRLLQPVPIDITVNMSIITRLQTDMDQIISNWAPYCDPYIVISWKRHDMPSQEIRSAVHWSGDLALGYPVDINNTQSARVTCDTSFVIKGWLFKNNATPAGYIFNIDADFTAVNKIESLDDMQAIKTVDNTDSFEIVGRPQITFLSPYIATIGEPEPTFSIWGQSLGHTTSVYASGGNVFVDAASSIDPFANTSLSATYVPFDAIPVEFEVSSENLLTFTLPTLANPGKVDIIIVNPAGYGVLTHDTYSQTSTYQYPFSSGIEVI
jgi:hypothetical protein